MMNGSGNSNSNSNNTGYDYSNTYLNNQQSHSLFSSISNSVNNTRTTSPMNQQLIQQQQQHYPSLLQQQQQHQKHQSSLVANAYLASAAANAAQHQQHHGPATASYDPTIGTSTNSHNLHHKRDRNHHHRSHQHHHHNNNDSADNDSNDGNSLYMAYLNASYNNVNRTQQHQHDNLSAAGSAMSAQQEQQQQQQQHEALQLTPPRRQHQQELQETLMYTNTPNQQQQQQENTTTIPPLSPTLHQLLTGGVAIEQSKNSTLLDNHHQQQECLSPIPFATTIQQQLQLQQHNIGQQQHLQHQMNSLLFCDDETLLLQQLTNAAAVTAAATANLSSTQQQQQHVAFLQHQQLHHHHHRHPSTTLDGYLSNSKSPSYQPSLSNGISNLISATMSTTTTSNNKFVHRRNKGDPPASKSTSSKPAASDGVAAILHVKIVPDTWMDDIQLNVPTISLTPISGIDVLQRIQQKLCDVVHKYIPCVDFLVQCQQDLRRGIDNINIQKRYDKTASSSSKSTRQKMELQYANQFYNTCVQPLAQSFYNQNKHTMLPAAALSDAMKGLSVLEQDAYKVLIEQQRSVQSNCCDTMKSAYLGGMKDGESWGLRKWLSKHGNALHVCTDLETILHACQKLPRDSTSTKQLAYQLRTMTKPVLLKLQKDIPASYQKHSSAHPYLPFFHRLESALRSMSSFDPDDDDVICLDDDSDNDDDVVEVDMVASTAAAPKTTITTKRNKRPASDNCTIVMNDGKNDDSYDEDDKDDSNEDSPKRACVHIVDDSPIKNGIHQMNQNTNPNVKDDDQSSSGESESESIIEIIDIIEQSNGVGVGNGTLTNFNSSKSSKPVTDWKCPSCSAINLSTDSFCFSCGESMLLKDLLKLARFDDLFDNHEYNEMDHNDHNNNTGIHDSLLLASGMSTPGSVNELTDGITSTYDDTNTNVPRSQIARPIWPLPIDQPESKYVIARVIANNLEQIASLFDHNQQSSIRSVHVPEGSFWDGTNYGEALRLFADIIRSPESYHFLECVDDDQLYKMGNSPLFSHVIKHPLSLRQIARSLLGDEMQQNTHHDHTASREDGYLTVRGLTKWNMWIGKDLLQAIDLVFLNSLAYGNALNQGKSQHRSSTNQLRKKFWNGITDILSNTSDSESRKQSMPTRRAEKSGFVVYKIGES